MNSPVDIVLVFECPYCSNILFAVESMLNDDKIVICEKYIDDGLEYGCGRKFIIAVVDELV